MSTVAKTKTLRLYSFLIGDEIGDSYVRVIAYGLRDARTALVKHYGGWVGLYLPGGARYSCSDASYSEIASGYIVQ